MGRHFGFASDYYDSDDGDQNLANFMRMYDEVNKHYEELPEILKQTERAGGFKRIELEQKLADARNWVRKYREANDILKKEMLLPWYHFERHSRWIERYNEAQYKLEKMDREITRLLADKRDKR